MNPYFYSHYTPPSPSPLVRAAGVRRLNARPTSPSATYATPSPGIAERTTTAPTPFHEKPAQFLPPPAAAAAAAAVTFRSAAAPSPPLHPSTDAIRVSGGATLHRHDDAPPQPASSVPCLVLFSPQGPRPLEGLTAISTSSNRGSTAARRTPSASAFLGGMDVPRKLTRGGGGGRGHGPTTLDGVRCVYDRDTRSQLLHISPGTEVDFAAFMRLPGCTRGSTASASATAGHTVLVVQFCIAAPTGPPAAEQHRAGDGAPSALPQPYVPPPGSAYIELVVRTTTTTTRAASVASMRGNSGPLSHSSGSNNNTSVAAVRGGYRLRFTNAVRAVQRHAHHTRFPLQCVRTAQWVQLYIDVDSVMQTCAAHGGSSASTVFRLHELRIGAGATSGPTGISSGSGGLYVRRVVAGHGLPLPPPSQDGVPTFFLHPAGQHSVGGGALQTWTLPEPLRLPAEAGETLSLFVRSGDEAVLCAPSALPPPPSSLPSSSVAAIAEVKGEEEENKMVAATPQARHSLRPSVTAEPRYRDSVSGEAAAPTATPPVAVSKHEAQVTTTSHHESGPTSAPPTASAEKPRRRHHTALELLMIRQREQAVLRRRYASWSPLISSKTNAKMLGGAPPRTPDAPAVLPSAHPSSSSSSSSRSLNSEAGHDVAVARTPAAAAAAAACTPLFSDAHGTPDRRAPRRADHEVRDGVTGAANDRVQRRARVQHLHREEREDEDSAQEGEYACSTDGHLAHADGEAAAQVSSPVSDVCELAEAQRTRQSTALEGPHPPSAAPSPAFADTRMPLPPLPPTPRRSSHDNDDDDDNDRVVHEEDDCGTPLAADVLSSTETSSVADTSSYSNPSSSSSVLSCTSAVVKLIRAMNERVSRLHTVLSDEKQAIAAVTAPPGGVRDAQPPASSGPLQPPGTATPLSLLSAVMGNARCTEAGLQEAGRNISATAKDAGESSEDDEAFMAHTPAADGRTDADRRTDADDARAILELWSSTEMPLQLPALTAQISPPPPDKFERQALAAAEQGVVKAADTHAQQRPTAGADSRVQLRTTAADAAATGKEADPALLPPPPPGSATTSWTFHSASVALSTATASERAVGAATTVAGALPRDSHVTSREPPLTGSLYTPAAAAPKVSRGSGPAHAATKAVVWRRPNAATVQPPPQQQQQREGWTGEAAATTTRVLRDDVRHGEDTKRQGMPKARPPPLPTHVVRHMVANHEDVREDDAVFQRVKKWSAPRPVSPQTSHSPSTPKFTSEVAGSRTPPTAALTDTDTATHTDRATNANSAGAGTTLTTAGNSSTTTVSSSFHMWLPHPMPLLSASRVRYPSTMTPSSGGSGGRSQPSTLSALPPPPPVVRLSAAGNIPFTHLRPTSPPHSKNADKQVCNEVLTTITAVAATVAGGDGGTPVRALTATRAPQAGELLDRPDTADAAAAERVEDKQEANRFMYDSVLQCYLDLEVNTYVDAIA